MPPSQTREAVASIESSSRGTVEPVQRTLERIRSEFLEMPGLRLTIEEVERLCGIDRTRSRPILDALVDARFLCAKSAARLRVRPTA
jgi:hypothetical protein